MGSRLRVVLSMTDSGHDFTEAAYRELLRVARDRYIFRRFEDALTMTDGVLWRHDVDMSPHRALALARIERDEQVHATYFTFLHSTFYNALEADVVTKVKNIAALGHDIGLHFDPQFYGLTPRDGAALEREIVREREILESTIGAPVRALSFHDPDVAGFTEIRADVVAGLVNAYGSTLRTGFAYCSDSNGYWRFKAIGEVLRERHPRVQVLTHPEWWVPNPMSPRDRIARAIEGRASSAARRYDEALRALNRENRS
jgi:hypothetical protein